MLTVCLAHVLTASQRLKEKSLMVDKPSGPDTDEFPVVPDQVTSAAPVTGEPVRDTGPQRRTTGFVLAALVVLFAVIIGAVVFLFRDSDSDDTADGTQALATVTTTVDAPTEPPTEPPAEAPEPPPVVTVTETPEPVGRPVNPALPGSHSPANEAARSNTPAGNFNNVYTGTTSTSPGFALAVRDAFVRNYLDTGELNAQVRATSPVTGQGYDISCQDNGEYVTCTGGNNAVVYIS
ncbi:hypothetical protein CFAEC_10975 [Corynebacterium faecale]|uniref:hypothetical protein n=1 Tax=Corynebacterium faecale TaxID=1758466 RepID=UPI0025B2C74F|nr:hypothetical protein [Corynebacterium faecale]WJY93001.1 hypothetical protein CFAEC_10975 [Corynebacterium faecale]